MIIEYWTLLKQEQIHFLHKGGKPFLNNMKSMKFQLI